jgi:hypothetical protein
MNLFVSLVFCFSLSVSQLHADDIFSARDALSRTYQDVQQGLKKLAQQYPTTTKLFSIGLNDQGKEIQAVTLGRGPVHHMVVATHHGNEYGSTETALGTAESLAKLPLDGIQVTVIPVLNISGYDVRSRYEMGKDPNRNYPGVCATQGPFTLKSTRALADFIDKNNIVASATLHTFSPVVAYPWGFGAKDLTTPYDNLFIQLAKYATEESHYDVGNSTVTLYPADGTYEDYAFWKHGIWSLLFELGHSHNPTVADVMETVQLNIPGLRRFFEKSPTERAPDHAFHSECESLNKWPQRKDE